MGVPLQIRLLETGPERLDLMPARVEYRRTDREVSLGGIAI